MRAAPLLLAFAVSMLGCEEPVQLSSSGRGAFEVALTRYEEGLAASWFDTRTGSAEIYLRLIDEEGVPHGDELRLTEDDIASYEPDIAAIGSGLAVAWYEKTPTGDYTARLGLWDAGAREKWTTAIGSQARNPVVRTHGNRIFSAWLELDQERVEVRAGWWDVDGRQRDALQQLGAADPDTWHLDAEIDADGVAWVAWDSRFESRSKEIFLSRFDPQGVEPVRITRDDGFASTYPNLAFATGRATALTWLDERDGNREVYLSSGSRDELFGSLEERAVRITSSPGPTLGAIVAWNGDRLGLAWCDKINGQNEIYFQDFDRAGAALADADRLTHNETSSLVPAIAPWRGGFALAWNELVVGEVSGHNSNARSEIAFAVVP